MIAAFISAPVNGESISDHKSRGMLAPSVTYSFGAGVHRSMKLCSGNLLQLYGNGSHLVGTAAASLFNPSTNCMHPARLFAS